MITTFDPDLVAFAELAEAFAAKELKPHVEVHDRYPFGPLYDDAIAKAWEAGFFAINLSEKLGGIDGDIGVLCTLLDRISQIDASLAGVMFTTAMAQSLITAADAGSSIAEACDRAKTVRDALLACPVFCNPGQLVSLPSATIADDAATLNGTLDYLTLGNVAAQALVPARVSGHEGYGWFLVKLDDPGVSVSDPIFSLGLHACPSVDVRFSGVRAVMIGAPDCGATYFASTTATLQLAAAAISAGIMKGALNEASAYARERMQGGRKIIDWSEVRMIMANMAIKTRVADLCLTQACALSTRDLAESVDSSLAAALHIQELACELVNDGVQLLGGNGYMKDYGQEKRYRDARQVQALLGLAPLRKLDLCHTLCARAD